jgi:hypothetical protein
MFFEKEHVQEASVPSALAGQSADGELAGCHETPFDVEDHGVDEPLGRLHRRLRLDRHRLHLHDGVERVVLAPSALRPEDGVAAGGVAQELLPEAERHAHERLRHWLGGPRHLNLVIPKLCQLWRRRVLAAMCLRAAFAPLADLVHPLKRAPAHARMRARDELAEIHVGEQPLLLRGDHLEAHRHGEEKPAEDGKPFLRRRVVGDARCHPQQHCVLGLLWTLAILAVVVLRPR